MQKNVFKDHIAFEVKENDAISNLGMKTLTKHNDRILSLRKVSKNGNEVLICCTEGTEKFGGEEAFSIEQIKNIFIDLSVLLSICDESPFLDCSYIELSKDLVYFDTNNRIYYFPVIPINRGDYSVQQRNFDDCLVSFVNDLYLSLPHSSNFLETFRRDFLEASDKKAFIEKEVYRLTKEDGDESSGIELELEHCGAYGSFSLYICKEEFVIGKSEDCDGVLSMNPTISRHHCVISRTSSDWMITDLNSSNGTYVGDFKLNAAQPVLINDLDTIRISDMEFKVKVNKK